MIIKTTVAGEYRLQVYRRGVGIVYDGDWFPNLITNYGLDHMGVTGNGPGAVGFCRVGTGSTTPQFTDTSLVAQIASTSSSVLGAVIAPTAPNYITTGARTWTFAVGAVVGNIAEIGLGSASTGNTLFSRALILDGVGTPTTITLTALDQLIVAYRLAMYPPITDTTGTVTIGGVSYNQTARAARISTTRNPASGFTSGFLVTSAAAAYSGSIGANTTLPTGSLGGSPTGNWAAYSSGNYYRDITWTWAAGAAPTTPIRSVVYSFSTADGILSETQIEYSQVSGGAAIPKSSTNTLSLTVRHSWGRR